MERTGKPCPPQPDLTCRPPSMEDDDPSQRLIVHHDDHDEGKPAFKLCFSTVKLIRLITIPIAIADFAVMVDLDGPSFWGVIFLIITMVMTLRNVISVVHTLPVFKRLPSGGFQYRVGGFSISYAGGRRHSFAVPKGRSYVVNAVDLAFCISMIIVSVSVFKTDIWHWRVESSVGGLSITVACLQLAIAVLGMFPVFRNVKIDVYPLDDEKAGYHEIRLPSPENSERGRPISVAA